MKVVLQEIDQHKKNYIQLPFFHFLRDDSRSTRDRLAFFPCMAHFTMSFADLNKYVLRSEPPADELQHIVNQHSREDESHWPWYIEDFCKLGFDKTYHGVRLLEFLWSDETCQNRIASYRIASLLLEKSSVQKLAAIEAIEQMGNVLFEHTEHLAHRIKCEEGLELRYLGSHHRALETGHVIASESSILDSIELDEGTRTDILKLVAEMFAIGTAWTTELLHFAQKHSSCAPSHLRGAQQMLGDDFE